MLQINWMGWTVFEQSRQPPYAANVSTRLNGFAMGLLRERGGTTRGRLQKLAARIGLISIDESSVTICDSPSTRS